MLAKERIEELKKEVHEVSIQLKGFRIETYADLAEYEKLSNYFINLCDKLAYGK